MKKTAFIFSFLLLIGCASKSQNKQTSQYIDQGSYIIQLKDSVAKLNATLKLTNDSIRKFNRGTIMTVEQHNQIDKYLRLRKYFDICQKKPSQWKYYKGWSTRVFIQPEK